MARRSSSRPHEYPSYLELRLNATDGGLSTTATRPLYRVPSMCGGSRSAGAGPLAGSPSGPAPFTPTSSWAPRPRSAPPRRRSATGARGRSRVGRRPAIPCARSAAGEQDATYTAYFTGGALPRQGGPDGRHARRPDRRARPGLCWGFERAGEPRLRLRGARRTPRGRHGAGLVLGGDGDSPRRRRRCGRCAAASPWRHGPVRPADRAGSRSWSGSVRGRRRSRSAAGAARAAGAPRCAPTRSSRPGRWSHVALAWDGRTARLYVNGRAAGKRKASAKLGGRLVRLRLGGDRAGSRGLGTGPARRRARVQARAHGGAGRCGFRARGALAVAPEGGRVHPGRSTVPTAGGCRIAGRRSTVGWMAAGQRQAWSEGDEVRLLVPLVALVVRSSRPSPTRPLGRQRGASRRSPSRLRGVDVGPGVPLAASRSRCSPPWSSRSARGGLEPILFEAWCSPSSSRAGHRRSRRRWRSACWLRPRPIATCGRPGDARRLASASGSSGSLFPWAIGRASAPGAARRAAGGDPRASSPSRRRWPSGGASRATSTTSSATGSPRSCCRSPARATCCAATPPRPRRRCARPRRWAGAAWPSCGARVALLRRTTRRGGPAAARRRREIAGLVDRRARGRARRRAAGTRATSPGSRPSVGVAVYRIAQEALANAARHAPDARTVAGPRAADGHVTLVAETPPAPPRSRPAADRERPRYGLVGMRERATRSAASSPPARRPTAGG